MEMMLRSVFLALLCCTASTEQTNGVTHSHIPALRLDYPTALSYYDADAFCKSYGLQLRAPTVEYAKDVLSKLRPNETSISFFLPERYLSGSLCSILRTYARDKKINNFKTFGSCRLKRYFACGPLLSSTYKSNSGQKGIDPGKGHDLVGGKKLAGETVGEDHGAKVAAEGEEEDAEKTEEGSSSTKAEPGTTEQDETDSGPTATDPVTDAGSTATQHDVTSDASIATGTTAPDEEHDTDVAEWSGIRTATIIFSPINALILSVCLWAFCCTEFLKSVRTTLHLHLCALLCFGQLSLVISSCQCSAAVGALLQFVYLGALAFSVLEGIHLIHASFSEEAPSMSLFYVVMGYSSASILAAAGFAKLGENFRQYEQLCVLNMDSGAGWLVLVPVIAMIVINVTAIVIYEFRISYLSENATRFPDHLEARGRLIRSLGVTTSFLGFQLIFGAIIQLNADAFSVLFFSFSLATSIAILVNHVACDREVRASMARVLGNRGKTAQRLANILRPAPPKVDGLRERVTYHSPPKVSDNLRSTLDRGIRPSIHLIRPLDHIPVSR